MRIKKTKDLCIGCHNDYYNHDGHSTTEECWSFKSAKVVTRYRIGWWRQPDSVDAFTKVTTLSCHTETGQFAFMEELPAHLRGSKV